MTAAELDQLAINAIRTPSIDAVEQGKSGHPGMPMALPGQVSGMKAFGAFAPLRELPRKFGFEPEKVVAVALEMLGRQ